MDGKKNWVEIKLKSNLYLKQFETYKITWVSTDFLADNVVSLNSP